MTYSCTDPLSGVDTVDPPTVLSGEGAGQSATGTCSDLAGNSASATVSGISIDKTTPGASASRPPVGTATVSLEPRTLLLRRGTWLGGLFDLERVKQHENAFADAEHHVGRDLIRA